MVVNHNVSSLITQNALGRVNVKLDKSNKNLSTGCRINSAADDSAGLAIVNKMKSQIRGLRMADRNMNDGISLIQTAEGGMGGIQEMLQRQRELILQGLNDTYTDEDRDAIQIEIDHLITEIDEMADNVEFNKIKLLNGSFGVSKINKIPIFGTVTETYQEPILGTITETRQEPIYDKVTIPIGDAVINQIQATVTDPPVNANGTFRFFATNNNDDLSQLLYGAANPGTSNPSIRVNGIIYPIRNLILDESTVHDAGVWSTTYGLRNGNLDLTIIQKVSIVDNPLTIGGQSYKIDYEVINNNPSSPVTFDLMYHVDTQLGPNDSAPFAVDGQNITNNTSFPRDGDIPGQIEIFDDITSPFINGVITVNSKSGFAFETGSEPDRVNLGRYSTVNTYDNLPSGLVGDSGYSVIWENRVVGNQSCTMTTYYGVKNPPPEVLESIGETAEIDVIVGYREVTETREGVVGYREATRTVEGIVGYHDEITESPGLWIQCGANRNQGLFVSSYDCRVQSLGLGEIVVRPRDDAEESITRIDAAINKVSGFRAIAGAEMNRLMHTISTVETSSENMEFSLSNIEDADMALEMSEYTKNNVITQASTSMLAQANSRPQNLLQLLQ